MTSDRFYTIKLKDFTNFIFFLHFFSSGKEISLSKVERSSDQVIKPVNLEALSKWVGQIPGDVLPQMDQIAPMLRKLGYDPYANPPNYGEADKKIQENTFHISANKEYWKELAKKYSIHVKDIPGI